jgi:hypothetical protein
MGEGGDRRSGAAIADDTVLSQHTLPQAHQECATMKITARRNSEARVTDAFATNAVGSRMHSTTVGLQLLQCCAACALPIPCPHAAVVLAPLCPAQCAPCAELTVTCFRHR